MAARNEMLEKLSCFSGSEKRSKEPAEAQRVVLGKRNLARVEGKGGSVEIKVLPPFHHDCIFKLFGMAPEICVYIPGLGRS